MVRYLLLFAILISAGCKMELHSQLDENEANEVIAMLMSYGIETNKEKEGKNKVTILVDKHNFAKSVELMTAFGLPKPRYVKLVDVFPSDSFVPSPAQEWARLNYVTGEALSKTISDIPGVVSAQVHIVNPRKEGPLSDVDPAKVSALLLVSKELIVADLVPQIKRLISHSVNNVSYDQVAVVVVPIKHEPKAETDNYRNYFGIVIEKSSTKNVTMALLACLIAGILIGVSVVVALRYHGKSRAME
ncbi:type III secretion system inner membrane ring lipoprotein SctJ [Brucella anthropi]|uniref:type III secretion system inner membrane ring lipoprotein SctJ n=1 Tax=Brucella anthropi TaxID=529 RepID=UPI00384CC7AF